MKSATAKALDSTYNRMQWAGEEYLLEEVIDEAADRFKKPGEVYSEELILDRVYLSVLALRDGRI